MDREKIIRAAEICLRHIDDKDCPIECSYFDICAKYEKRVIFQPFISDALILLKEQEPVAVYEGKVNKCVCGNVINRYWHPEYCGFCGKKLLWY